MALASSLRFPCIINSTSWPSASNLYKAGADNVPKTMYAAVTGKPIPRINEARATKIIMIIRLPSAQLLIIKEKVFPIPVVVMTLITRPIHTSKIAVVAMFFAPLGAQDCPRAHFMMFKNQRQQSQIEWNSGIRRRKAFNE